MFWLIIGTFAILSGKGIIIGMLKFSPELAQRLEWGVGGYKASKDSINHIRGVWSEDRVVDGCACGGGGVGGLWG